MSSLLTSLRKDRYWNRLADLLQRIVPQLLIGLIVSGLLLNSDLIGQSTAALIAFGLAGLIIGIIMVIRPEAALLLTIAYIPMESSNFRPIDLPGSLTVAKLLGAALLGSFFFAILFRRRPFRVLDDIQDYAVLAFVVVMLMASVGTPYVEMRPLTRMLRMFAFYFAAKNLITSENILKQIMWAIFLSGTYASVFGINEFYKAREIYTHDIRVGGVFMDPNDYAAAMIIVIMVGIYLFILARKKSIKLLIAAALAAISYAVILSGSRGGIGSLMLILLIFVWRQPNRTQLFIALTCVLILSFPVWPQSTKDRIFGASEDSIDDLSSDSASRNVERRASYQTYGLELFVEKPLLGYGYDSFSLLYPFSDYAKIDNPMNDHDRYRRPHNAYIDIAVGMGTLGILAYAAVLLGAWYSFSKVRKITIQGTPLWALASACELSLISFMLSSSFLSIQHFKYLWLMVGISSALFALAKKPPLTAEISAAH